MYGPLAATASLAGSVAVKMRASKLPVVGSRAATLFPSNQFALGMLAKMRPETLSQAISAVCKDSSATESRASGVPTGKSSFTTLLERFGSGESLVMLAARARRPALSVCKFTVTVTALAAGTVKGDETRPPLVTEFVPELDVAETKDELAGINWVRTTLRALFGPRLEIVKV